MTYKDANDKYRKRFGRFGWDKGVIRYRKGHFVFFPRWVDNVGMLIHHLGLRIRGRCISCQMRGVHKKSCYHSWTIRDDLRLMHLWRRRPGR
jgi:hypothetical protein